MRHFLLFISALIFLSVPVFEVRGENKLEKLEKALEAGVKAINNEDFLESGKKYQKIKPSEDETEISDVLHSDIVIREWAADAVQKTMTFNHYSEMHHHLESLNNILTEPGIQKFKEAMKKARIWEIVESDYRNVTAVVSGQPKIEEKGIVDNKFSWTVNIPITVTYKGSKVSEHDMNVALVIVRDAQINNQFKIGIKQWVGIPASK